jgi:predicted NodU family carbamoyl transferase
MTIEPQPKGVFISMAQYTFSFLRSEYDRIPYQLKKDLSRALEQTDADEKTKKLAASVCAAVEKAVVDLSKYAQDQLEIR